MARGSRRYLQHSLAGQASPVGPEVLGQDHGAGPHVHPVLRVQHLKSTGCGAGVGGGWGSRFYRPASPPPPPGGTSGMRSVSAAGPSVKRYRRTPPRRRPRLGSPMAAPPPNGGRPRVVPGRADQSAPSPVVASGGAPPRALMAAGRLLRAGPVPALRAASPECRR